MATNITDYKHENGRRYHAYKEGSKFVFVEMELSRIEAESLI